MAMSSEEFEELLASVAVAVKIAQITIFELHNGSAALSRHKPRRSGYFERVMRSTSSASSRRLGPAARLGRQPDA